MATKVAGELYESITGQLFELGRQLRQSNGYPFDAEQLKRHLQVAVEGRFQNGSVVSAHVFSRDMTKDGWVLLEDAGEVSADFAISNLEVASFLKQGENSVNGETMRERAKEMQVNLGQCHAEFLLAHQDQIPEEWKQYYLIFPGTVWRGRRGYLSVPCLLWNGGRWKLLFDWLDDDWHSDGRFLVARK